MDPVVPSNWSAAAASIAANLGAAPGETVLVRDHAGREGILQEVLLALECAGATPLLQIDPPEYLERLLAAASLDYLNAWDRRRRAWLEQADRVLVLTGGAPPAFADLPQEAAAAWQAATGRLTELEEERRLPFLLAAVPTSRQAARLGMDLADLEAALAAALAVTRAELHSQLAPLKPLLQATRQMTIQTGPGCRLDLAHGDRRWLFDDGAIEAADQQDGAIVSNLPAGSIYTTVLEAETHGQLWLASAGPAKNVCLTFEGGRITRVDAESGAGAFEAWLDSHSGESRRVSHVGLGLNPALRHPTGWILVDEHIRGALFICLGENRYMGGQNSSSLNVDYDLQGASLWVDGQIVVSAGQMVV